MEAYQLSIHPFMREKYEVLSENELIVWIQNQVIDMFTMCCPEERIQIRAMTMDSVPLTLLGGSLQRLGIVITNILERFRIHVQYSAYQETVLFPNIGVLIGFIFHHITEQNRNRPI